jgi:antitoxin PrlF
MPLAQSRVTAQGQTSVPKEVRKKLGLGPGSVLQWTEENGRMVVRRAGLHSSEDICRALFPKGLAKPKSLPELKEGIPESVRARYARR